MRLLLIEDNDALARLLVKALARAQFEVDAVSTVSESLAVLNTTSFSVIVLDLGLPDGDGLTVLHQVRANRDTTPVLILSARDTVRDRIKGLHCGADDYLGKPFALEELIARIETLLRRPTQSLGAELRLGCVNFDTKSREFAVNDRRQPMPPREATILEALLRWNGRVVPKQVIEHQFCDLSRNVDSNTIEVYVHRLRKLLRDSKADVEIYTVYGVGYRIQAVEH